MALTPIYRSDPPVEGDAEELVLTVYGGDTPADRKVLAQAEVLTRMMRDEDGVGWYGPSELRFCQEMDRDTWVNSIEVLTPQVFRWVKKTVHLPVEFSSSNRRPPLKIGRGETITIQFPERLLEVR